MVLRNKWTSLVNISYEKVTKAKSALFTVLMLKSSFLPIYIHFLWRPLLHSVSQGDKQPRGEWLSIQELPGAVQLGIFPQRIHADAWRTCKLRWAQQPRIMCARTLDMNHTRRRAKWKRNKWQSSHRCEKGKTRTRQEPSPLPSSLLLPSPPLLILY